MRSLRLRVRVLIGDEVFTRRSSFVPPTAPPAENSFHAPMAPSLRLLLAATQRLSSLQTFTHGYEGGPGAASGGPWRRRGDAWRCVAANLQIEARGSLIQLPYRDDRRRRRAHAPYKRKARRRSAAEGHAERSVPKAVSFRQVQYRPPRRNLVAMPRSSRPSRPGIKCLMRPTPSHGSSHGSGQGSEPRIEPQANQEIQPSETQPVGESASRPRSGPSSTGLNRLPIIRTRLLGFACLGMMGRMR